MKLSDARQPREDRRPYAPRQVNRPINQLIGGFGPETNAVAPQGSLRDAETGAYYTWLNLMKMPETDGSRFVVLQEDGGDRFRIRSRFPFNYSL